MQVKNKETIDKILNILNESLRENNGTPSIYEIADAINVNPSTVSRYINYLVSEGIIENRMCQSLQSSSVPESTSY